MIKNIFCCFKGEQTTSEFNKVWLKKSVSCTVTRQLKIFSNQFSLHKKKHSVLRVVSYITFSMNIKAIKHSTQCNQNLLQSAYAFSITIPFTSISCFKSPKKPSMNNVNCMCICTSQTKCDSESATPTMCCHLKAFSLLRKKVRRGKKFNNLLKLTSFIHSNLNSFKFHLMWDAQNAFSSRCDKSRLWVHLQFLFYSLSMVN